jgi:hypothetical protein
MATPPVADLDTVMAVAATAIASANLVVSIATIHATVVTSCDCVAVIEVMSQQEQTIVATTTIAILGVVVTPVDLVTALTVI